MTELCPSPAPSAVLDSLPPISPPESLTEDERFLLVPSALFDSEPFRLAKRCDVRDSFAAYLHVVLRGQFRQLWFDRNKGAPSDWTGAEIPYEWFEELLRVRSAYRNQFLPLESAGLVVRTAEAIYHQQAAAYLIPIEAMQRGVPS